MLKGAEVKSIRHGRANLQDGYARVEDGEVWLHGMHVSPYEFSLGDLDPVRRRKLLLHAQADRRARADDPGEGPHARPDARLLQGRAGQGRDRARPGQARATTSARRSPSATPSAKPSGR